MSGSDGQPTGNGFRVCVDDVTREQWHQRLELFADACIHQTWAFGAGKWGEDRVSHLCLYEGDEVVAAAQVIIVTVPVLGAGIAHCKFGPLWRRPGQAERADVYVAALRALRDEYARRRGLLLRLKPWEAGRQAAELAGLRSEAGMQPQSRLPSYDTFVLDLDATLDELRAGLKPKWRYNLKKAEARDITITRSRDQSGVEEYAALYREMRELKTFVDTSEVDLLPDLIRELPGTLRPTVFTAWVEGEAAASIVVSQIGDVGFYLFGATGPRGRDTGASYVLFWDALGWLQERGCTAFDLVGSRPQGTGGGAGYRRFKAGLTGRNGAEESMQDWEVCDRWMSRLVVQGGTRLRWHSRQVRHAINGLRERARKLVDRRGR